MSTVDNSTIFIHVQSGRYPLTLQNLKQENPYSSFPPNPLETSINNMGYAVVDRVTPPTEYEGVLFEAAPQIDEEDGRYKQTWEVRPFTPEEIAENLMYAKNDAYSQLDSYRDALYNGGVLFTDSDNETFVVHIHDQNVQALCITATRALIEKDEQGPAVHYITHDASLNEIMLDAADLLALYKLVSAEHDDAVGKVVALRKKINDAQTIQELPTIPEV